MNSATSFPENLPAGWKGRLGSEKEKPYFRSLSKFLVKEYQARKQIFPPRQWVLRALQSVDFADVKVVILGQDPYHGSGQAVGLSFAVPNELRVKPPSLVNIYKEIEADLRVQLDRSKSDLTGWADQGVLLLNTVLTVRASQAFSHRNQGWENFTDQIILELDKREDPVVFILWGAAAQKKRLLIKNPIHKFLESPHPSPLSASRGFFGCKHFSKANRLLEELGKTPVDWAKICAESASD